MDVQQFKQEIIAYSKTIGIDKIGFTTAAPFLTLKSRLLRQQELNYQSGFEEPDIEKRTNPALLFHEPASIISIAVAYPSKMTEHVRGKKGERRGLFSKSSWGNDYHVVLKYRLQKLADFITVNYSEARVKSMVDTGELSDRAVAERAGIGWSGKNCSIITPEFGSYVYLGEMITNIPFEPDTPIEDMCGSCNKCVEACPTGALVQGGQINAKACISYLTQTKDSLPEEYRSVIGNRLYGCDTCQMVCPYNKGMDFHFHEELEPDPETAKPLLQPLLSMSNREFKERFGHTAGSWRGKKPIQRNAILALGHFKEASAIPDLKMVIEKDPRPVIRGTAAWTLGKIGGSEALTILRKVLETETDDYVLEEIQRALSIASDAVN
ncbi:tRNA epoxyqueuosine(34) reductase QueG [Caldibacillus lycopersici]|uniref:tRNA epoxyqueuosine(34) reductase QueG n=1 Tax=Perspicuibacillus lycopersici TaxID=1325689 RepID=A0AAE3LMJ2_9BACI|nr:tRNA epoxyqueuosine(34) reductase QueG [Perspicuibacillus lycopersici]MCU9612807.1 tRNA epoxyqueuosine(34) reductase QueG [Perspicuibacillus lycopersici]